MENTNRETAAIAGPQYDWKHPETNESYNTDHKNYIGDDEEELSIYAMANTIGLKPEEEEDKDAENDEEEEEGDWGHVDPAEGNSPFPSSNDPSGPGSAV